jgi:hypothetical protein
MLARKQRGELYRYGCHRNDSTALEIAVLDTPLRSSSASQRGTEQTHEEADQRILKEIRGRVYYDVGGFYKRYFKGKT